MVKSPEPCPIIRGGLLTKFVYLSHMGFIKAPPPFEETREVKISRNVGQLLHLVIIKATISEYKNSFFQANL